MTCKQSGYTQPELVFVVCFGVAVLCLAAVIVAVIRWAL